MRLIKVANVAFNVVLIAGKGGILDFNLYMKLSDFSSRNVFWVNYTDRILNFFILRINVEALLIF